VIVGGTKKSAAMIWLAWFVRNVLHVCDDGRGRRRMYFATVDWLTATPNFCNSPWIRGAPQSGLALDSSRMRAFTSAGAPRRPVRRRLFHVQNRRKPVTVIRRRSPLDDVQNRPPAAPRPPEPRPEHLVRRRQSDSTTARSVDHRELMAERHDFEVQRRA